MLRQSVMNRDGLWVGFGAWTATMAANFMRSKISILACTLFLTVFTCSINGQFRLFGPRSPRPTPQPKQMRTASQLISRQPPLKVNQGLLEQAMPDNTRIVVSI